MEIFLMRVALEEDDGITLMKKGKFAEARMSYEEKLCKASVKLGKDHLKCLNIKEKVAFSMLQMGNYLEAKQLFDEVVSKREKIFGDCHPDSLRIYLIISFLIMRLGNKLESDLLYIKLTKILDSMQKNEIHFMLSRFLIAVSYVTLFKTAAAEKLLQQLLEEQAKYFWKGCPFSLLIKVEIGHAMLVDAKYSEAIAYHEDILKNYSDFSGNKFFLYNLCRIDIATSLLHMDKFSEAKIQLEDILRKLNLGFSDLNFMRFNILCLIAHCHVRQQQLEKAKILLEEVLKNQVKLYSKESLFYFETMLEIGEILIYKGNFSEVKILLEELFRNILVFGKGSVLYLKVLRLKCTLYTEVGEYKEATAILEEVLLRQLEIFGKYHPDYLESKEILARLYTKSHKFEEALNIFEDILRITSSIFGADHKKSLKSKMHMAATCIRLRKFGESVTLLKEVLKLQREKLGDDHEDTVLTMGLLAVSNFGLDKEEGVPAFEVLLGKMEISSSNVDLITCISQSLMDVGDYENSKRVLEKVLEVSMDVHGKDHPLTLDFQINMAKCFLRLDELTKAKTMFYEVQKKVCKVYSRQHPSCLRVKTSIALAMQDLCEHEEAIILLKEVLKTYEENDINNTRVLDTIISVAESLSELDKLTEMKIMIDKASIMLSKVVHEDNPLYIDFVLHLASLRN